MTVKDNTGDVAWQLEGKYMDMKVLGDNLEAKISKASNNQPVDVTCPSKNILIAKGAAFTCDVMVGMSATKIVFTCTSIGGGAASYRWESNPKTNMKLEVPAAWNRQVNGEVMVITTPSFGRQPHTRRQDGRWSAEVVVVALQK
jgi:hypothetical protein